MDTTEVAAVIGAASALGGVVLKIAYDSLRERTESKRADADRFLDERKATYDAFWDAHKQVTRDAERLREIALIARAGKAVKEGVLESFPPSGMPRLVDTLDALRRIAHTSDIVKIAERMVALHGDTRAALRHLSENPDTKYGLPLFLANRMREDQELEFIAAYRRDLGVGPLVGSSKDWPVIKRQFPLVMMERAFRAHVRHEPRVEAEQGAPIGPFTAKDAAFLASPRIKAMLLDTATAEGTE
jgi:hypothetical protein